MAPELVIGNFNLSGHSLAAWVSLAAAGLEVRLRRLDLKSPEGIAELERIAPSGRLPVLVLDGATVAGPLAIAEYAAEHRPALWPEDAVRRAQARAVAEEALYGFWDLVACHPLDLAHRFGPPGRLLRGVERDLRRLEALLLHHLGAAEEGFLFGAFSVADAMLLPLAARVAGHGLVLAEPALAYVERLLAHPLVVRWRGWAEEEVAGRAPSPQAAAAPEPASRSAPAAQPAAPAAAEPPAPRRRLFARRREPSAAAPERAAPPEPVPAVEDRERVEAEREQRAPPRPSGPAIKPIGDGILRRRSRTHRV